jgi:hypothetical protein
MSKATAGPTDTDWRRHRDAIKRLYMEEHKTLATVMAQMESEYNFKAS